MAKDDDNGFQPAPGERERRLIEIFRNLGIGLEGINNNDRDRSEEREFPWRFRKNRGKPKSKGR